MVLAAPRIAPKEAFARPLQGPCAHVKDAKASVGMIADIFIGSP